MMRRGGLVRGVARTAVVAGTATAVSGRVARRQNNKWAEQEQAQYEQQAAQQPVYAEPPPAPAPAGGGDVDELKQIAEPATPRASSPTRSSPPRRPRSSGSDRRRPPRTPTGTSRTGYHWLYDDFSARVGTRTPGVQAAIARPARRRPGARRGLRCRVSTRCRCTGEGSGSPATDARPPMVDQCRARLATPRASTSRWRPAPGPTLPDRFGADIRRRALHGNSLAHAPTPDARRGALIGFAGVLVGDGALILDSQDWRPSTSGAAIATTTRSWSSDGRRSPGDSPGGSRSASGS